MDCPKCAKRVTKNRTVCKHCGTQLQTGANPVLVVSAVVVCALFGLFAVGAAFAIPNLIEARVHGNEAAAIGALKTITTAQSLFREGDKESDTNYDYGSLQELSDAALIDSVLGSGEKQGYVFTAQANPVTSEFLWTATANPSDPGSTGKRYFAVDQSGVIYCSDTHPISPCS